MRVFLGFALTLAWALYLGGTMAMELVWRPVQRYLPPGQVNVVCQKMGRRYRWIALGSLAVAGAALAPDLRQPHLWSSSYGRTVCAGFACWLLLAAGVLTMALRAHPALHRRHEAVEQARALGLLAPSPRRSQPGAARGGTEATSDRQARGRLGN